MTKLEHLEQQLHEKEIYVYNFKISNTKKAMCLSDNGHKYIALNEPLVESKSEKVAILAEELGHFETAALYTIKSTFNTPIARSNRIKFEAQAMQWAYKQYLPPWEIKKAFICYQGDYHLIAEHCQVTMEFLNGAIEYYRSHGIDVYAEHVV